MPGCVGRRVGRWPFIVDFKFVSYERAVLALCSNVIESYEDDGAPLDPDNIF